MKKRNIINNTLLWERISDYARKAGRISTRPVLLLYYVLMSKDTPKADKALIFTAISYLVFPIDILDVRRIPFLGLFDEIASISVAYQRMCKHITPEMQAKVDGILDRWFPEYTYYIEVKS